MKELFSQLKLLNKQGPASWLPKYESIRFDVIRGFTPTQVRQQGAVLAGPVRKATKV